MFVCFLCLRQEVDGVHDDFLPLPAPAGRGLGRGATLGTIEQFNDGEHPSSDTEVSESEALMKKVAAFRQRAFSSEIPELSPLPIIMCVAAEKVEHPVDERPRTVDQRVLGPHGVVELDDLTIALVHQRFDRCLENFVIPNQERAAALLVMRVDHSAPVFILIHCGIGFCGEEDEGVFGEGVVAGGCGASALCMKKDFDQVIVDDSAFCSDDIPLHRKKIEISWAGCVAKGSVAK
jgi:hypothetical protein